MEKFEQIKSQINQVEENQFKNQQQLRGLEQMEKELFEINKRGQSLLDRLYFYWKKDPEIMNQFEQDQTELNAHYRKVNDELETKRKEILRENQNLNNVKGDLYTKLKKL